MTIARRVPARDRVPAGVRRGGDVTGPSTSLSEVVDRRAGLIRASGHLTSLGADLLRGTADGLRGSGHVRVVLDLRGVRGADAGGLDILRELRRDFAAEGGELVLRT